MNTGALSCSSEQIVLGHTSFQDIEIRWNKSDTINKENKIDYGDIAGPNSAFLRLLGHHGMMS